MFDYSKLNQAIPGFRGARRSALLAVTICSMPLALAVTPAAQAAVPADASILNQIGATQLAAMHPNLNGAGVVVAQVEAGGNNFEADPNAVAQPTAGLLTYINSTGASSTTYSSAAGSGHANMVGNFFYGGAGYGVAAGVAHVYNYNSSYFLRDVVGGNSTNTPVLPAPSTAGAVANPTPPTADGDAPPIPAKVVNQSFIITPSANSPMTPVPETYYNIQYDNYTDLYGTIFVSGVGDGTYTQTFPNSEINPPATAYNSIAVGAYGGQTGVGPTTDGRSKPDIVAPGSATSYTTALVSGAATLLVQAGSRGTGYSAGDGFTPSTYATAATDERTIKALLLNGAVKPAGWSQTYTNAVGGTQTGALDPRYGAGVLNVYNSYQQLAAGREAPTSTGTGVSGGAEKSAVGWDFNTISTASQVNTYEFNLAAVPSGSSYTLTTTLVWNVGLTPYDGMQSLNNLQLQLFGPNGQLIGASASLVDNVQELYLQNLTAGQYNLVVTGIPGGVFGAATPYALAFNFQDPAGPSVPEPSVLALLAAGMALPLLKRLHRNKCVS